MPRIFGGKSYRKHSTGVWPEYVAKLREELKSKGYLVRVTSSWKVGRKDIWVYKP